VPGDRFAPFVRTGSLSLAALRGTLNPRFGTKGVFAFIAASMPLLILSIGTFETELEV
jgi:hypothetical protein